MKFSIAATTLLSTTAVAVARDTGLRNVGEERKLQASAKFAAAWSNDVEVAGECLNTDDTEMLTFWSSSTGNTLLNFDWCDAVPVVEKELVLSQFANVGMMKIPQGKEMLINLSAQIDILTVNTATSVKNGGRALAKPGGVNPVDPDNFYGNIGATSASAGVTVSLFAIPQRPSGAKTVECKPEGGVTMASRYVELRNQIGGEVTYEDCYNDPADGIEELVCPIKVANTTLSSTIGLAMDTAAAHSFQWLCVDLDSDVYDVVAHFTLTSEVANLCDDSTFGDCSTNVDLAAARIALNKRIMTIQQVRAPNKAFADAS